MACAGAGDIGEWIGRIGHHNRTARGAASTICCTCRDRLHRWYQQPQSGLGIAAAGGTAGLFVDRR
jgi:hypothetical protein